MAFSKLLLHLLLNLSAREIHLHLLLKSKLRPTIHLRTHPTVPIIRVQQCTTSVAFAFDYRPGHDVASPVKQTEFIALLHSNRSHTH
jgi:hypothetical protein